MYALPKSAVFCFLVAAGAYAYGAVQIGAAVAGVGVPAFALAAGAVLGCTVLAAGLAGLAYAALTATASYVAQTAPAAAPPPAARPGSFVVSVVLPLSGRIYFDGAVPADLMDQAIVAFKAVRDRAATGDNVTEADGLKVRWALTGDTLIASLKLGPTTAMAELKLRPKTDPMSYLPALAGVVRTLAAADPAPVAAAPGDLVK